VTTRWGQVGVALCAVCLILAVGFATATTAAAGVPSWTTYRHDGARSGVDPDSTSPLAPTQAWQSPALDGQVYGQPLVYGGRVYVATENDSIYALNAATGAVVWMTHLGTPVPQSVTPCTPIGPTIGITSTPAIDPASGRIYVVTDTWDGVRTTTIAHQMFALSLSDGSVATGPVPVDPPGSLPRYQLQRVSLALTDGKLFIGYGSYSDCGLWHGYLVAVPEAGGPLQMFEVDGGPGESEGSLWDSGNAPVIDSSGNVWIATGNGSSKSFDFQDAVMEFAPGSLAILDYWAPLDWSFLDGNDLDIGSSMPVLLPNGLVFQVGKQGIGYLLNAGALGGVRPAPYEGAACDPASWAGSWGGGIYYNGVIYVACQLGLHALSLDSAHGTFTPVSGWHVDPNGVSPPIEAGGLIWSADYDNGLLVGIDPSTGQEKFSANLGGFEHFQSPSAAGGRLFVANQDQSVPGVDQVTAFYISDSSTTVGLSSSANPAAVGDGVTLTATISPLPDAGTVAFTDAGVPIGGCGAVPVDLSTGRASCTTSFTSAGGHPLAAGYSGDHYYSASSDSLTEVVTSKPVSGQGPPGGSPPGSQSPPTGSAPANQSAAPVIPVISHLQARVVRHRLHVTLSLSEPAGLTVVISRLVPGRMAHRRCHAGAKRGSKCQASQPITTLHASGQGRDATESVLQTLPPGRYSITVTADASGARSKPASVSVLVRR
jgi:outer membrane protein assembly factor BamB